MLALSFSVSAPRAHAGCCNYFSFFLCVFIMCYYYTRLMSLWLNHFADDIIGLTLQYAIAICEASYSMSYFFPSLFFMHCTYRMCRTAADDMPDMWQTK